MNTFKKSQNLKLEISGNADQEISKFPDNKITLPLPQISSFHGSQTVRNINLCMYNFNDVIR
jgi:hypothetical protein